MFIISVLRHGAASETALAGVAQCARRATRRQCVDLGERAPAVGANRLGACESSAAAKSSYIVDVATGQISAPVKCDDP